MSGAAVEPANQSYRKRSEFQVSNDNAVRRLPASCSDQTRRTSCELLSATSADDDAKSVASARCRNMVIYTPATTSNYLST